MIRVRRQMDLIDNPEDSCYILADQWGVVTIFLPKDGEWNINVQVRNGVQVDYSTGNYFRF